LGQDTGVRGGSFIMKKLKYNNAPDDIKDAIECSTVVEDFLPSPEELVYKEENVKVTLELSKRSIKRFKQYAQKKGFPYQRMIRSLIDQYAEKVLADK
jgi:predicted DNA binding CopG/RHH family protein